VTVKTTVTVWVRLPLVAVMVIVYVPGGVWWKVRTSRVDVPLPPGVSEMLLELRLSLGLLDEQIAERDTDPVNPFRLPRSIVTLPELPAARFRELTLVVSVKSTTLTVTWTE
jgi:hypothetical protein